MSDSADQATNAHPEVVHALVDWGRYAVFNEGDRARRIEYVKRELDRLEAEGVSPLYAAVTLPLAEQQTDAFRALAESGRSFALRLVEGVTPPATDSQGREIARDKRGKVLSAKVGTVTFGDGGTRAAAALRGGTIYRDREITARPSLFTLEEALTVMRRWGYRVRAKRADRPGQPPRRNEWLVVHVNEDGTPIAPRDAPPVETARSSRSRG